MDQSLPTGLVEQSSGNASAQSLAPLEDRKRGAEGALNSRDFSEGASPMKKTRSSTEELCNDCNKIDFQTLLRPSKKRLQQAFKRSFEHFASTKCSLCRLIYHHLRSDPKRRQVLTCNLFPYQATPENRLRNADLDPVVGFEVKFGPRDSVYYSVVGKGPWARPTRFAAVRRPLQDRFDPSILRVWTAACEKHHGHVKRRDSNSQLHSLMSAGRFRLIDVSTGMVRTVRQQGRYFALSYVWGQSMAEYAAVEPQPSGPGVGSPCDASRDQWEIKWQRVPQTIRDAAALLTAIGEKYLWVDSLCIDQSNAIDKQAIIGEMSAIYENAHLTIIAAGGVDADAGLHRLKTCEQFAERPTMIQLPNGPVAFLPSREGLTTSLRKCKWNTRAWTYQEQLLSPRSVIFTKEEAFFTCSDITCSETLDIEEQDGYVAENAGSIAARRAGKPYGVHDALMSQRTAPSFNHWSEALQEYSIRELTHSGDRLDAFAGISRRFLPSDVSNAFAFALCGLPPQWFWHALQWCSRNDLKSYPRIEHNARASRAIPSWTWAGWVGDTYYGIHAPSKEKLEEAYEVTMVDSANLVVRTRSDLTYWDRWPFEPEPCELSSNPGVTVHMWAKCVFCYVHTPAGQSETMNIFIALEDTSAAQCESGVGPKPIAVRPTKDQEARLLHEMRQQGSDHPGWASYESIHIARRKSLQAKGDILQEWLVFGWNARFMHQIAMPIKRFENTARAERVDPGIIMLHFQAQKALSHASSMYIQLQ